LPAANLGHTVRKQWEGNSDFFGNLFRVPALGQCIPGSMRMQRREALSMAEARMFSGTSIGEPVAAIAAVAGEKCGCEKRNNEESNS
jgi:hypothetical protein